MDDDLDTRILDLLPAYSLGGLGEAETRLVAEYLAANPAYQAELDQIQKVTDHLALATPDAAPPDDLKQRLLAQVQPTSPLEIEMSAPALSRWQTISRFIQQPKTVLYWQLATLSLLIILLATNLFLWQQVNRGSLTTNAERMQSVRLTGTDLIPGANGFLLMSADGLSGAVVVDELPQLGEDQQYQLWLHGGDKPVSGAIFSVDELSYGGARVRPPEALFNYSRVSVTIEPAGGSEQPTGDQVLIAPLFEP